MIIRMIVSVLCLSSIFIMGGRREVRAEEGKSEKADLQSAGDVNMFGETLSPRIVRLDAGNPVALLTGGRVKMEIIVPDESGTVADYAGKELKTFLEQSFGQDIPLLKAPTGQAFPVILGDCELARKRGVDVNHIPYDGFTIKIDKDAIVIAGPEDKKTDLSTYLHPSRDFSPKFAKGTWHGVTDFLERFVGVRFYFPGEMGTLVPALSELNVPTGIVSDRPDKMRREVPYTVGIWHDRTFAGYDGIVANRLDKKIQYSRLKMSSRQLPFGHGLSVRGYIDRFGKSHPDYFALMDDGKRYCESHTDPKEPRINQLCYSSGIKEEVFQDAASYLKGESTDVRGVYYRKVVNWPTKGIQQVKAWYEDEYSKGWEERYKCFSVMPDDGFYPCRCAKCQAIFRKGEKASSTLLWQFTADIARQLKQKHIPGYVAQCAYDIYRSLPDIDLPDNILVMICPIGPWLEKMPALRNQEEQNVRDWAKKLGHKVQLWNYAINSSLTEGFPEYTEVIPHMTPRSIGSYYRRMSPYSDGAFLETSSKYYLYNYLNVYVFAKVHWDASLDVDALLEEHYKLMFGAAAPVMKRYYEALEDLWLTKIRGEMIETSLGPQQVTPSPEVVWGEIMSPEQLKIFDAYFDEAERLTAADAPALKRVKFMRAELFDRMKEYSRNYTEKKQAQLQERLAAKKVMGNMSLLAVKAEGISLLLDGNADEAFWQKAPAAWLMPFKNKNASGTQGVFKAAFDGNNIYIAFKLTDPEMNLATASEKTGSENAWQENNVEIFLNPSGDLKKYFQIIVTSAGVVGVRECLFDQRTGHVSNNPATSAARVAVKRDEKGWSGELVMPRTELGDMKKIGFPVNFCRHRVIEGKPDENYSWSRMLENSFHETANWSMLYFESDSVKQLIQDGYLSGTFNPNGSAQWRFAQGEGEVVEVQDSIFPKALKITAKENKNGFVSAVQELPKLKPETRYCLSFLVKTELSGSAATGFIWDGKHTCWLPGENKYEEMAGMTPWKQKSFVFKTHAVGDSYSVRLGILTCTGSAYFQDVSLIELPE